MTFKYTIIILFISTLTLFSGCTTDEETFRNTIVNPCAQDGETIGGDSIPEICCAGLKPMEGWPGGYTGSCSAKAPQGLTVCSLCGDDLCNIRHGENICNCPEDCTQ